MQKNTVNVNVLFRLKENILRVSSEKRSSLMGQVLTIVDASARDEEQRKAIKDLVRNAFWSSPSLPEERDINEIFDQFSSKFSGKTIDKMNLIREGSHSTSEINWFPNEG